MLSAVLKFLSALTEKVEQSELHFFYYSDSGVIHGGFLMQRKPCFHLVLWFETVRTGFPSCFRTLNSSKCLYRLMASFVLSEESRVRNKSTSPRFRKHSTLFNSIVREIWKEY